LFDGVTDHRQHLLAARVGRVADRHERDGVNARVSIAPVGLKASGVGFNRLFDYTDPLKDDFS
jgi:hypothetical protein